MSDDLHYLGIAGAARRIERRELSPVELTRALLDRIDRLEPKLHAFRTLLPEGAMAEARAAEAELMAGYYRGPMHGIPVAHKEWLDVKGVPNISRARDAKPAAEDATAVQRLREAGSVLLGTLHAGTPPGAKAPCNPWNLEHITGGSSSGSGAAIAAGLCAGSVGEDTAGSIRRPASMCGTVGFKPTYGLVSRYGMMQSTWSMDHVGPITWTVEDAAILLQAIAGNDPSDPNTSQRTVPDYRAALNPDPKGLRVGVPRSFINADGHRADPEVIEVVDAALKQLESAGASIRDVDVPSLDHGAIANTIIHYCQALAAKEDGGGRTETNATGKVRSFQATLTSGADYFRAQLMRNRIERELAAAFQQIDVLATPAQVEFAPKHTEYHALDNPLRQLQNFDAVFCLVGLPAISVPCGFGHAGLPIGLQLVGKPFDEASVLRAAYVYEQLARWFERRPPV